MPTWAKLFKQSESGQKRKLSCTESSVLRIKTGRKCPGRPLGYGFSLLSVWMQLTCVWARTHSQQTLVRLWHPCFRVVSSAETSLFSFPAPQVFPDTNTLSASDFCFCLSECSSLYLYKDRHPFLLELVVSWFVSSAWIMPLFSRPQCQARALL